jgi:polynucleotide 5'-kinase involved in rRNA processing
VTALEAYLRDARLVSFPAALVERPRRLATSDVVGALCGLDDAGGDTQALGVIADVTPDTVRVLAPMVDVLRIARVRVGRERRDGTPLT